MDKLLGCSLESGTAWAGWTAQTQGIFGLAAVAAGRNRLA